MTDHHHDHSHGHHGHSHAPKDFGRTFLVAAALNTLFIVAEIIYGLKANSLALLADAGHNVSDVLSLMLSWGAWHLSKRAPNAQYTYGLRSTSILAALVNALLLLVAIGAIAWEAIGRFHSDTPVMSDTMMWVAGLGILVNGFTAWLFSKGQHDLNIRAAFLHLAADAAVSLGVVIAGFLMLQTGWSWLDPTVSLLICAVIVIGTWGMLRDATKLALHAVPAHIDPAKVRAFLLSQAGVREIHDLHIWGMSTTEVALSAHLLMPEGHPGDQFLHDLNHALEEQFQIVHATIQIEMGDGHHACHLAPETVV